MDSLDSVHAIIESKGAFFGFTNNSIWIKDEFGSRMKPE